MTTFETRHHRQTQQQLVHDVAALYRTTPLILPTFSPVDALLIHDRALVGALEVKRRYNLRARYRTVWLERPKVVALLGSAALRSRDYWHALFAVRWDDATGVIDVTHIGPYPLVRRSLKKPRALGDLNDECFLVPVDVFMQVPHVPFRLT